MLRTNYENESEEFIEWNRNILSQLRSTDNEIVTIQLTQRYDRYDTQRGVLLKEKKHWQKEGF
jgi:hypothetical protein